jgi:hypothetical protein
LKVAKALQSSINYCTIATFERILFVKRQKNKNKSKKKFKKSYTIF